MDQLAFAADNALTGQHLAFQNWWVGAEFRLPQYPADYYMSNGTYTWKIGDKTAYSDRETYGLNGAATSYYRPTQDDVGKKITSVSASVLYNGEFHAASTSADITILNANDLPEGLLLIEGDWGKPGGVLRAVSTITDKDGMGTLSYQWKADGQVIAGATGDTLTLTQENASKDITAVATYVDGFGQAESVVSGFRPTDAYVRHWGTVAVTGTVAAGQTLHAAVSDADLGSGQKIYYQWQAEQGAGTGNYQNIEGAWNGDYTVGAGATPTLRLIVTYADRLGVENHIVKIGRAHV